ncbi:1-(5-phosphoribosyl)-5-[(5-phosphoribosylamino)methylideneamino]imidazole-4-carboxamide isomerase [Aneurinibacillus thermoaerophilus]|jgi:phosphoribosylformimino-5-aminoimidazole carboxamide ribotide isomerase|uniref:1-(5-phosphoribosyl)-5-[(5- phosphoribosylamino)methylideneamino]imidazole-4- carboxamide isomerase n=1 Tax=Aneurinibacillus thermoaerophilus TaxID=143495 RepID=UPI002E25132F|nr:1-(5-phosphoribosyl)-5-[(5-phosphoribosylamino)methylideneamino]imidazole-4-carboxamide isomerase [Aneurinibacillus thermoaerophilus]MED0680735.1 1-(5-phosphoribosyl)-5-[(5-phosphoribosylamino)methylideneamino]imidazole-4-carboxamide isomerase [Aneurinibacillus thermoaerophilus]MED0738755.1 1-(5-phosphoribosyl)-5-[(5-phosphoribosylamino)methylideneamino]imidazole-4-carboxamide isomerase [Aneurinibacillus thermoaerophilus]MED0764238.1 1-(5-phosphoribosyl)-5-[(5-phosphoribosylamino)methylidenea
MDFIIYPAIDIRGGKCVRLLQGDYNKETVYGDSPVEIAKQWAAQGAEWIHLVDLDGAKAGKPINDEIVLEIARKLDVPVQVGGGLRRMEDVEQYIAGGVSRVILGTAAIQDEPFTEQVLTRYGDKVAIGIDARDGYVATHGWLKTSEVTAEELAKALIAKGAATFIYTDISRDGTLEGPNTEAIVRLARATGKNVIASGGVSREEDLLELARYAKDGVGGAIVGKALYTERVQLPQALKRIGEVV